MHKLNIKRDEVLLAQQDVPGAHLLVPQSDRVVVPYQRVYQRFDTSITSGELDDSPLSGEHLYLDETSAVEFTHDAVQAATPAARRMLQALHMHRWVSQFTLFVEDDIVVPVCDLVRSGLLLPEADEAVREDARFIGMDESYHSLFSTRLGAAILEDAGVESIDTPLAIENRLVDAFEAYEDECERALAGLATAVATETLITGELGAAAKGVDLYPRVQRVLDAHKQDEGKHSRTFAQWFRLVWPNLTRRSKRVFAFQIGTTIRAYLEVDTPWLTAALTEAGITCCPLAVALEVNFHSDRVREIRSAARSPLALLRSAGAFEDEVIAARFRELDLID